MYVLSSTNRLFRCIIILQRGKTREMLEGEIKTWLTSRQPDILPQRYQQT